MATKKSKKKVNTKKKACPCPDHKGALLPATLEYWHKGGDPDGLQGYCKGWRNKAQNAANKTARKAAKKIKLAKKMAAKGKKPKPVKEWYRGSKTAKNPIKRTRLQKAMDKNINSDEKQNPIVKAIEVVASTVFCNKCSTLCTPEDFQSNGRGGIRQPCKACIKSARAEKKRVDKSINSDHNQ